MDESTQEKINQLSLMEQNLQTYLLQKQQFQAQLIEIDSALKELETAKKSYRIIGNIMVSSRKEDIIRDLKSKKEMLNIRIGSLEKQEQKIRDKAKAVQTEVMSSMSKEKKK